MYEEVINRDKTLGEPPKGVPIHTFLLEERQSILHDIFFLVSQIHRRREEREVTNKREKKKEMPRKIIINIFAELAAGNHGGKQIISFSDNYSRGMLNKYYITIHKVNNG